MMMSKVIKVFKMQYIFKGISIISAMLVLGFTATGASPELQSNTIFSGAFPSIGQSNALFSDQTISLNFAHPSVGIGNAFFSGQSVSLNPRP
jgi:hypothetical protein